MRCADEMHKCAPADWRNSMQIISFPLSPFRVRNGEGVSQDGGVGDAEGGGMTQADSV